MSMKNAMSWLSDLNDAINSDEMREFMQKPVPQVIMQTILITGLSLSFLLGRSDLRPKAEGPTLQDIRESGGVASKQDMYYAMQEWRTIMENSDEIWPVVDGVLDGEDPDMVLERSAMEQN